MKTLIFFLLFFGNVCDQRGHVKSSVFESTGMIVYREIIDLPDRTLEVCIDNNIRTYFCQRCDTTWTETVKPDTTVIWVAPIWGEE